MKITALDIRQKTFEKSFRGVDKDEVQAFLNTVSQQWERLGDENRELRLKLEHAQHDVQKMREVESQSLYRTLKTAEDTGNNITEQAQREADLRLPRSPVSRPSKLLTEARDRARGYRRLEAYQTVGKNAGRDAAAKWAAWARSASASSSSSTALVRDLHHLASDALEKVEQAPAPGPRATGRRPSFRGRPA